jgi:hypothetical protein
LRANETSPKTTQNSQTPLLAQETRRKNACWQMDKPKTKLCQPTNHAKTETAGKTDLLADGRAEKSGGPHAGKATMPKTRFANDETAGDTPWQAKPQEKSKKSRKN